MFWAQGFSTDNGPNISPIRYLLLPLPYKKTGGPPWPRFCDGGLVFGTLAPVRTRCARARTRGNAGRRLPSQYGLGPKVHRQFPFNCRISTHCTARAVFTQSHEL